MKLIRIDIENFGKLSDFHLEMNNNPMIVIKDNGWGKSTLAAFIRVMFFGFMDEGKKKVNERERNILKPWNHGTYGGAVSFEVNGRQYRLERTFGQKSSEDVSRLVDITTRIVCNDFDLDIIGEQLFGINGDAYIRTLFVGQNNLAVRNDRDGIDDSITAKIGNLTEATDDINNYDTVIERLKNLGNSIKSGNKKGEINLLLAQKDGILRKINTEDAIQADTKNLSEQIEKMVSDLENDSAKMQELDIEYEKAGRLVAVKTRLESRNQLVQEIEECMDRLKNQKDAFENRIPDIDEIDRMLNTIRDAMALKERCQGLSKLVKSSYSKHADSDKMPEKELIESTIVSIGKREECRKKLNDAEIRYEHELEMNQFRRDMLTMELKRKRDEYEWENAKTVEAVHKNRVMTLVVAIIVMAITVVGAGILFIISNNLWVWSIVAVAAVCMLLVIIINRRQGEKRLSNLKPPAINTDADTDISQKNLQKLKELIAVHSEKMEIHSIKIKRFCEQYHFTDDELLINELHRMLGKLADSTQNKENLQEYNSACEELSNVTTKIQTWFADICAGGVDDWLDTALQFKQSVANIKQLEIQLQALNEKLDVYKQYEEEYDSLKNVREISEIIRYKNELDDKMDSAKAELEANTRQLEKLQEMQNELEIEKQNLAIIDEKLEENQHKYDIITKTMGYLNKAKELLSSRYMDPIGDAFAKYYSYITTEYLDAYEVDANIRLTRQEQGIGRDINSLSKGYKDLVDVALRMALIDVMYEGEKPWIIMDDPFVNLDSEKLGQVREFLEEVSREYQILYFTCHESRA